MSILLPIGATFFNFNFRTQIDGNALYDFHGVQIERFYGNLYRFLTNSDENTGFLQKYWIPRFPIWPSIFKQHGLIRIKLLFSIFNAKCKSKDSLSFWYEFWSVKQTLLVAI